MACLYCAKPAIIGPHVVDGDCCNHAIVCGSCGKSSTLSVNLALVNVCTVRVDETLPLFRESA
jgi:hypothetical protein